MARILAIVSRRPVWLTATCFCALTDLVLSYTSLDGYVEISPMTISRLRREIEDALQRPGYGKELIQPGLGGEYRLHPSRVQVLVDRWCIDGRMRKVLGLQRLMGLRSLRRNSLTD